MKVSGIEKKQPHGLIHIFTEFMFQNVACMLLQISAADELWGSLSFLG